MATSRMIILGPDENAQEKMGRTGAGFMES